ncbi:DinB family protein [Niabella hibiscisoli]|uniref:DinB family protein n=1 Tax=Niabella hibiscisoli TaxID=1825928 RepID=UPI001F0DD0B3|nr:DinB family protein [Niabella hibiscisoli]MCH5717555.1 DinB family protein [Niabella hibiscisoli]
MTKEYFKELADYNLQATIMACGWLAQLSDEYWKQHVVSSFNSIRETVLHMISAENAWVQRFHKKENIEWLQSTFKGTKDEHLALWKKTSTAFKEFINALDEAKLTEPLDFKRLNGDAYSMPYYQLFAHAVNHASYHRGQLVTMLRQVGFTDLGSTDLLNFYRTN